MNSLQASLSTAFLQDSASFGQALFAWYIAILPFLKVLSLVVSALLIWGIWYSRKVSHYKDWKADQWRDKIGKRDLPQRAARRAWKDILQGIKQSGNAEAWAESLKKAESVVQEGLRIKGYMANTDDERLRIAREAGELQALKEYTEARAVHKRMSADVSAASHEEAIEALRAYKKITKELGLL